MRRDSACNRPCTAAERFEGDGVREAVNLFHMLFDCHDDRLDAQLRIRLTGVVTAITSDPWATEQTLD
jgi:hypothetical protein